MKSLYVFLQAIFLLLLSPVMKGDEAHEILLKAMKAYKVPVVSYAIIDGGKIVRQHVMRLDSEGPVSSHALFQAASISKSLTSFGALLLVDQNRMRLDQSANDVLTSWKIPDNLLTEHQHVSIRHLMNMTSGLSVSGFPGYERHHALPNAFDVLNGTGVTNHAPIRVRSVPGSTYAYSGGAFQVLGQVIEDVAKRPFTTYMNHVVLKALGMQESLYQYPLKNARLLRLAVPGYMGWSGAMVKHGWHQYACAGAGGMWSTPTDIAKFLLNVSASYQDEPSGLLSHKMAREMLRRQAHTDYGLGVVVGGEGRDLYFWKAGHNLGYHSLAIMFPALGQGAVIMTNSETGDLLIRYWIAWVAKTYHWHYYFPFFDELVEIPA